MILKFPDAAEAESLARARILATSPPHKAIRLVSRRIAKLIGARIAPFLNNDTQASAEERFDDLVRRELSDFYHHCMRRP